MLHVVGNGIYFAADAPIEFLYLCSCVEVNNAVAEEVECLFAYLLGIVPRFEDAALAQVVPYLIQLFHTFLDGAQRACLFNLRKGYPS